MLHMPFAWAKQWLGRRISRLISTATVLPSDQAHSEARTWLSKFTIKAIPSNICEVTFSRASGPGGQHVNKVHTKASLRIKTKDIMPLLPELLHAEILRSRYHAPNSQSLIISSDVTRRQADNVQECFEKLCRLIVAAGKETVRGETKPDKIAKIKAMRSKSNQHRLMNKRSHGHKKAARASRPA